MSRSSDRDGVRKPKRPDAGQRGAVPEERITHSARESRPRGTTPQTGGGARGTERRNEPVIRTMWKTASEQCEILCIRVSGYRVRLWVRGRLVVDEHTGDADTAVHRARELRLDWTGK